MSAIGERIEPLARQAAEAESCLLVDASMVQDGGTSVLRVLVERSPLSADADRSETISPTLDDCAAISDRLSALLDLHDPLPGGYRLEVSSPGLNRPLKKAADFTRFRGRTAAIRTNRPLQTAEDGTESTNGEASGRKSFKGELAGMDGEKVLIRIEGTTHRIPLSAIGKANLEHDFRKQRATKRKF